MKLCFHRFPDLSRCAAYYTTTVPNILLEVRQLIYHTSVTSIVQRHTRSRIRGRIVSPTRPGVYLHRKTKKVIHRYLVLFLPLFLLILKKNLCFHVFLRQPWGAGSRDGGRWITQMLSKSIGVTEEFIDCCGIVVDASSSIFSSLQSEHEIDCGSQVGGDCIGARTVWLFGRDTFESDGLTKPCCN